MSEQKGVGLASKLIMAIVVSFFTVVTGVQVWLCQKVIAHDNMLAVFNANLYSVNDAKNDGEKIQAKLNEIQLQIARLPDNLPPKWFLEDYRKFKDDFYSSFKERKGNGG